jgi:hypothetical protein
LIFEGADAFGVLEFEGFVVETGSGVEGGVVLAAVVVFSGVDDD